MTPWKYQYDVSLVRYKWLRRILPLRSTRKSVAMMPMMGLKKTEKELSTLTIY